MEPMRSARSSSWIVTSVWGCACLAVVALSCSSGVPDPGAPVRPSLREVEFWTYNIQDVDTQRQRDALVGTHFDLYVLDPVVTAAGQEAFDIAGLVRDIRQHNIVTRNVDPIILAYVDVGQAETWRWYWQSTWRVGDPSWIVGQDPDGWEGCLPVAYWHPNWEAIVITGYQGQSHIEATLTAGFDGVYMDWVEAFSDVNVVAKANADGVDPAAAMFSFIEKIRTYAREDSPHANPRYLIVAQNASDLYAQDDVRYRALIDAIALEGIWYDGDGGFDDWDDPRGYNVPTNDLNPNWTEEVLADLEPMKPHIPIFCVEYAQDLGGRNIATQAYNLAFQHGFIPYCSRRALSHLSTTPYPPGYSPIDY